MGKWLQLKFLNRYDIEKTDIFTTELLVDAAAHLLSGDNSKFCMMPSNWGHRSLARSDVERSQDITLLDIETTYRLSELIRNANTAN